MYVSFYMSGDRFSATVTPIGVKFCTIVDIGPGEVFSPLEGTTRVWKSQVLTAITSKTASRSVACQVGARNIGSTGAFPGESPIRKNMYFCPGTDISRRLAWWYCPIGGFLHFWWRYLQHITITSMCSHLVPVPSRSPTQYFTVHTHSCVCK